MPKAVVCRELGPPERLRLETFDAAPLVPGQVRVAIPTRGASCAYDRGGDTHMDALQWWELLSYVVTVVGLPLAAFL